MQVANIISSGLFFYLNADGTDVVTDLKTIVSQKHWVFFKITR